MNLNRQLHRELKKFVPVKNVLYFSSCRNAWYTLLRYLVVPGDEVIIQNFLCNTLFTAISKAGATPVYADVDPGTLTLTCQEIKKRVTSKTKVIFFVHTYGNSANVQEIADFCKQKNILFVEDIAQSLGSSCNGKPAGTFGDYAVTSFTKQLINSGGGALLSNRDLLSIKKMRDQYRKKSSISESIKRIITSLYETRAFLLSHWFIRFARSQATKYKANLSLDSHFHCSPIEKILAIFALKSLRRDLRKRRSNVAYLQRTVRTQYCPINVQSSSLYLTFFFPNPAVCVRAAQSNPWFFRPWPGTLLADRILFVPNRPSFSSQKLNQFISDYHKAFK